MVSVLSEEVEVSCVVLGLGVGAALRQRGDLPPDYTPDHLGQIIQAACLAHICNIRQIWFEKKPTILA